GELTIADGGAVSATYGYLGEYAGSTGAMTVTGSGSAWTSTMYFYVGDAGDGILLIADGGEVNGLGGLGSEIGASGSALVTGDGSVWTASQVSVGIQGAGVLTVADGGLLNMGGGFGQIIVGQYAG